MKAVQVQIATFWLLISLASAQGIPAGVATMRGIKVQRQGRDVRVEITLSAPVTASVITASHPDRIVLELPNTLVDARQQRVGVGYGGVHALRVALHRSDPPVAHLVLDLDEPLPHLLTTEGNRIVLTLSPVENVRSGRRDGAPAAAASGGFLGVFRRKPENTVPSSANNVPASVPPAAPTAAAAVQPAQANAPDTSSSTGAAPSASRPARSSLQQGTVFPNMGTPGTGSVPNGPAANPAGFGTATTASANTNAPGSTATALPSLAPQSAGTHQPTSPSNSGAAAATSVAGTVPVSTQPPSPNPIVQPAVKAGTEAQPTPTVAAAAVPKPPSVAAATPAAPVAAPAATQPSKTDTQPSLAAAQPGSSTQSAPQSRLSPTSPHSSAGQNVATTTPTEEKVASPEEGNEAEIQPVTATDIDQQLMALRAANPNFRTVFKVKYVAEAVAYLDGGRTDGLTEGMKLEIKDSDQAPRAGEVVDPSDPRVVAELEVNAVADSSAVTDIRTPKRTIKPGDLAFLSTGDAQALVQQQALSATRKYPATVTFTEGDPLEEEARLEVPKPPLPSVNRARGRIGLDYFGTVSHGTSNITSSDVGLVMRTDITRLNGTYWNVSGYWRGRLHASSGGDQQTLQDLINRTYHLSMTYENPNSAWVIGFGRLYLPYAPSLDTIDGGYFGRRLGGGATVGIFAGSTPDPTSWSYNPDRRLGGAFINFEGGSYDDFKYTSTSGVGLSALKWTLDRPFVFFENGLFYKRYLSIYDSLQADSPRGNTEVPAPGPGLSRNFLTVRIQPMPRLELNFNHNYFRDIPTFDPALIGTGLLDKYLFQGFSAGARVEVVKGIFVYGDLGQSNRSGDKQSALNQAYGVTFNRLPWIGVRSDLHYSRFSSSFGSGDYRALTISRNLSEALRLNVLVGDQHFSGLLSSSSNSRFVNANIETNLGAHYFMQGGFTISRGSLSYDQWLFSVGYRFDSKGNHK